MSQSAVHVNPVSIGTVGSSLPMTAWNVQSIVYELLAGYMLRNDPEQLGFRFKQKYTQDPSTSSILLDIGYNWKTTEASKLPACFITRGDVELKGLTMNGAAAIDTPNSDTTRLTTNLMTVQLACIATNLGFTEQFAEYCKQALTSFQQEIKHEFGFRRFRLVGMSKPAIYLESKEKFVVLLTLETAFDEGWVVHSQDLRLKTVSQNIFNGICAAPAA